MIKAITFDFWNTLYKTPNDKVLHDIRINGFQQVLQSAGFNLTYEDIFAAFKVVWRHAGIQQRSYGAEVPPPRQMELILQNLNITLKEPVWDKAFYYYAQTLLEYPPRLNTDVKETLPLLRSRFKMAVICNTGISPGAVLRKLMRQDGIIDFFDHLVFSDEVGCAKPNPCIFSLALKKINVPSRQAVHVGDDMLTDVVGAKKAGMTAAWLAPDNDWKIPEADYHLRTVKELLNLW